MVSPMLQYLLLTSLATGLSSALEQIAQPTYPLYTLIAVGSESMNVSYATGTTSAICVGSATLPIGGAATTINGQLVSADPGGLIVGSSEIGLQIAVPSTTTISSSENGSTTVSTRVTQVPQGGSTTAITTQPGVPIVSTRATSPSLISSAASSSASGSDSTASSTSASGTSAGSGTASAASSSASASTTKSNGAAGRSSVVLPGLITAFSVVVLKSLLM